MNRRTGKVTRSGTFIEPLAEAGTAAGAGGAYLVGGWTGTKYATAVLRFVAPDGEELVARLPAGVRSPAVALVGRRLYVAGGRTQAGLSRKLFVVDTRTGTVRALPNLPVPVERAVLVVRPAARKSGAARLYLLGGVTAKDAPRPASSRSIPRPAGPRPRERSACPCPTPSPSPSARAHS